MTVKRVKNVYMWKGIGKLNHVNTWNKIVNNTNTWIKIPESSYPPKIYLPNNKSVHQVLVVARVILLTELGRIVRSSKRKLIKYMPWRNRQIQISNNNRGFCVRKISHNLQFRPEPFLMATFDRQSRRSLTFPLFIYKQKNQIKIAALTMQMYVLK